MALTQESDLETQVRAFLTALQAQNSRLQD
jgi:hypothetical protein